MNTRARFLRTSALALATSVACHGMAQAQDTSATPPASVASPATPAADAANGMGNGDIVVTAQRREQNLQKTPIAVTAFTAEMLQTRAIQDLTNVAKNTPGLSIIQGTASPNTIQVAMRGALEQNGGTITSESPVAIYIDDVYQSRLSAANYDLADIVRVEVLRGPQGTLYGRNSMTGAIKLITRQPDGQSWLTTDVSLSRFEEVRAKVTAGAPIGEHLAFAASGFYDDRNQGWQYDEATKQDVGVFRRYGGQLSFGLIDIPGVEAVVEGRYLASNTDGQHFLPINETTKQAALPFYDTDTPVPANGDNSQKALSLKLGYDFGGIKVRSISAYQHLDENWALDFSGGYNRPDGELVPGFYRHAVSNQRQFTQEFQALGTAFDDKLNYIVGAFYFNEKAHEVNYDDVAAFYTSYLPESLQMNSRSLATYAQADYKLFPNLTISAGIRYTTDHKRFDGLTQDGAIVELVQVTDRIKDHVWTPRFNVQYDISNHAMAYATISKGYRAAGFNSLVTDDPVDFGTPYKPETAWSYEIGTKLDAFDRLLRLNVAAYYERLSNLQTLAVVGAGSVIEQNAAKSKVEGIESELNLNPMKGLNLYGNLTYTYDHYLALDPTSQAAESGADRLPLISRWQYQAGGSYELPFANTSSILFSADYSYRAHYYSLVTLAPTSKTPGFGRANGTITYKSPGDHYEIYGQATNLFNTKNYFLAADFIPGVFGYRIPLEPRIWRIGFRFKM